MLYYSHSVGRHEQHHRKVVCLPTHCSGVKDAIRYSRMKQSFKYRVYPTLEQERWLYAEFKHQKRLYNYMLQMRSQMYRYGSISVSRYDQQGHLTKLRENSHYGKHSQDMQVETIKRVEAAYQHFFRRCKSPKEKKKGAPRFKGSVRSVTWELRKDKGKRRQPIRETGLSA